MFLKVLRHNPCMGMWFARLSTFCLAQIIRLYQILQVMVVYYWCVLCMDGVSLKVVNCSRPTLVAFVWLFSKWGAGKKFWLQILVLKLFFFTKKGRGDGGPIQSNLFMLTHDHNNADEHCSLSRLGSGPIQKISTMLIEQDLFQRDLLGSPPSHSDARPQPLHHPWPQEYKGFPTYSLKLISKLEVPFG